MKKKDLLIPIFTVLILIAIELFVVYPVRVDGHSMNPTLETNDQGFVLRHKKPKRYDIVVLESHDKEEKTYIKRIIGLPGEQLTFKEGHLYIHEKEYDQPFLTKEYALDDFGQSTTEDKVVTIPKDSYYVLGDNRAHSNDSRVIGPVKMKDIDGVFVWRFWPFNKMQKF